MHRKNTHFLTAERRLVEWFIKGTASDTQQHTTVQQAVFARQPNFGKFWVAPRTNLIEMRWPGIAGRGEYSVIVTMRPTNMHTSLESP